MSKTKAATTNNNFATIYRITKNPIGSSNLSDGPVKDVDDRFLIQCDKQLRMRKEHFTTILNVTTSGEDLCVICCSSSVK